MLTSIVAFSVRHAGVITALAIAWVFYGILTLSKSQFDVFPEFAPPQVTIQTEAPGLSPEDVETLVTRPIENAVNGVSGIESLRSNSIPGLSVVKVTFDPGADIFRARQLVSENLSGLAAQLPQGVKPPVITPLTSSTSVVLEAGLTSDTRSLMELRDSADWVIKPRLLSVPGVAKVAVFGGEVRQLQVQLKPEQLTRYNLSLDEAISAVRRVTGVQGAGFVDTANQRILLQTEANTNDAAAVGEAPLVHGTGQAVDLNIAVKDIADVVEGAEPRVGAAAIMGKEGVVLQVSDQFGANTREVTARLEAAFRDLEPILLAQRIALNARLFRPADFIDTAIGNIEFDLLLGAALVIAVLFLFLAHVRSAFISAVTIPLSLLSGVVILRYFNITLNTLTLGGLAIAIGQVVDDGVIGVENILRRLRKNEEAKLGKPRLQTIVDACVEVRRPVVFATMAVFLVFIPVLTLSGLAGRLFAPLGLAYIAAIFASLVVALTVTPALARLLIGERGAESHESLLAGWLKSNYVALLSAISRAPGGLIAFVGALMVVSVAVLPFFQGKFIPEMREGHFIVHMSAVPGTSLEESLRIGHNVTEALLRLSFVRSVSQRVGRAEKADDTWGTHYSEFNVDLKPLKGEDADQSQFKIRQRLAQFPGVNFAVKPFLTERVEETLSGYTAQGALNVYGLELDTIDRIAARIASVLREVPGAANVQLQSPPGTPQLFIALKPDQLAYWGLNADDLLTAIRVAFQGETVSQIYRGAQVIDVSVVLAPTARKSVTQVGDLPIKAPSGSVVKLSQLANVTVRAGRYTVLHDGARRVQTITFDVGGRDIAGFSEEAQQQIRAKVALPAGVYFAFAGTGEAQSRAQRDLLFYSVLAALAVVALIAIAMTTGRNLLLIVANLPFSLAGGILVVLMTGGILTLGAMVGFITVFGISLSNSILMIAHFEHLVREEGQRWNFETMLRGASERLLPILMTATVTGLGLLPLALGSGDPGREIDGPMAVVILGGLASSTLLNLCVLPGLAWRFARFGAPVIS